MKKKPYVLISAHEISPILGSECSSGWNMITRLSKFCKIDLIFAETNQFRDKNYKNHINDQLKLSKYNSINFIPIAQPRITNIISSFNKFLSRTKSGVGISFLYFLGVYFWEKKVYKFSKNKLNLENYDLIHHFNHISFREPGFLWKIDKPFVWGPVSGLATIPFPFLKNLSYREMTLGIIRNFLNNYTQKFSIRLNHAISNTSTVFCVTKEDYVFFNTKFKKAIKLLDVATYKSENNDLIINNSKLINFIWVGRLSELKALDLLFEVLKKNKFILDNINLKIIGDGPQKIKLKKKFQALNSNKIHWLGKITKKEVLSIMKNSDALIHTSIKEAGSAVILEALSSGLPVICHDAFGMSNIINKKCGFKISYKSPLISILEFEKIILKIINEPETLRELKKSTLKVAENYTWEKSAETIYYSYLEILKTNKI